MHLFAFTWPEITPSLIGWIVAGLLVGKLLWSDDRKLKALQAEANSLSEALGKCGFTIIPKLLTDFALLDFVKLAADFRRAAETFKDPAQVRTALKTLLSNMVKAELEDTSTRQAWFDSVYNAAKAQGLKPSTP